MSDYLADVQKYDAGADADVVQKIVKHLGIALRSRDASMVSCSDKSELDRVTAKWGMKKLGETDAAAGDAVVEGVSPSKRVFAAGSGGSLGHLEVIDASTATSPVALGSHWIPVACQVSTSTR